MGILHPMVAIAGHLTTPTFQLKCCMHGPRVSSETSFDSKQPKMELKQVLALSETKCLFRLFRFFTETASFGVSIEPKQKKDQWKHRKFFYILDWLGHNL